MPTKPFDRRKIYQERKKRGCCPRCGKKVSKRSSFIYCDDCREFYREYNQKVSEAVNEARKAKYERRKAKHQCPRCGKPLSKKYGRTICTECLEKQYKYNYGKKRPSKGAQVRKR